MRGKLNVENPNKIDNRRNFIPLNNNIIRNYVQISVSNIELAKFTIEEIEENIKHCELLDKNYYSLFNVFQLLKNITKLPDNISNTGIEEFFKHQQFIINKFGIMKRIFYEKKDMLKSTQEMIGTVDTNNTFIFVLNSISK